MSAVELVVKAVPAADLDYIDGVPAMTVTDALPASRGRVMTERLIDAARDAARRELITADQAQHVIEELTRQVSSAQPILFFALIVMLSLGPTVVHLVMVAALQQMWRPAAHAVMPQSCPNEPAAEGP